jgi:hypothetical protein
MYTFHKAFVSVFSLTLRQAVSMALVSSDVRATAEPTWKTNLIVDIQYEEQLIPYRDLKVKVNLFPLLT